MLSSFAQLRERTDSKDPKVVAVACAHDPHTLEAVLHAAGEGILRYILIGHKDEILRIGSGSGYTISRDDIIDASTAEEAGKMAVQLIRERKADFLLKGSMQTSTLLKEVVNKETGIGLGRPMSHIAMLEIPGYHKILGVTDGGMIPSPDLKMKMAIIRNAVEFYRQLGISRPIVSAVCAAETVSPKIVETVDAAALKEESLSGVLGDCYVEGPISFDLAMDKGAARIKGYESLAAGETDIMVVPNITAGNIMCKALTTFAGAKMAGCVVGAQCPVALNSRSASFEEKYNALLLCMQVGGNAQKGGQDELSATDH